MECSLHQLSLPSCFLIRGCRYADDAGRKFNAEGNLVDWWTTEDATSFAERASVIIDQFQQYQVEGKHLNGKLTQGESTRPL